MTVLGFVTHKASAKLERVFHILALN